MGELASYRLSDFILFTASAYYRQFELYNRDVWPLHLLAAVIAVVIIHALWRKPPWAGRVVSSLLAFSWAWVAVAFLYQRFYQIHVVADLYALAFLVQAGMIAWFGLVKNRFAGIAPGEYRMLTGSILLVVSLVIYPMIAALTGRHWQQFEMFVLAPDPTAVATVGILLFFRLPVVLYIIPVVWLLVSYTTLVVM